MRISALLMMVVLACGGSQPTPAIQNTATTTTAKPMIALREMRLFDGKDLGGIVRADGRIFIKRIRFDRAVLQEHWVEVGRLTAKGAFLANDGRVVAELGGDGVLRNPHDAAPIVTITGNIAT